MLQGATPDQIEQLALLIANTKLTQHSEQYNNLLQTVFDTGAKAFSAYYESKQKEEQEKEQKRKPFLELLNSVAQGDPEPLRQALIKENVESLDLSRKLNSYVDPAFYSTLVAAFAGTPVKTLLLNHNILSTDCINRFIIGLPRTNLTTFQFIGAVVTDESAKLLAQVIPKTALTSIDFNYNDVSVETDELIHSFKGLNLIRSKSAKMMNVLRASSDEEALRLIDELEFSNEFCSTEDKLKHLRLYLELFAPQNSSEIDVTQDPVITNRRKYKS